MKHLKDHLLSRLLTLDFNGDERPFTPEQRNELRLLNLDRVIESKILRINYTSYDIRRAYDSLRSDCRSFLMTLSVTITLFFSRFTFSRHNPTY